MTTEIYGYVCLAGVEFDIVANCNVVYVDNSFDHAFGTEHIGQWEIESYESPECDGDLREIVTQSLPATRHNRAFKKRVRRKVKLINRLLTEADPEQLFDDRAKSSAIDRGAEGD